MIPRHVLSITSTISIWI